MIQANELRIGNWVIFNTNTNPLQITAHAISDVASCNKSGNPPFFYEGVPLTEEWLLKFGFEYHHDTPHPNKVYRKNWDEGYFDLEHIISFHFGGNFISVEIQSVHTLQNLYFALTNEELTIKQAIENL